MTGTSPLSPADLESFSRNGFIAPLAALSRPELHEIRAAVAEHLGGQADSERYELTDDVQVRNVAAAKEAPMYEYDGEVECPELRTFPMLFNLWKVDPRFARVAHSDRLVSYAKQLLDVDEVLLMEDNVIVKMPRSKRLPWHQDYSYWPLGEPRAVTLWIALDDIGPSNGAMELAPGTQLKGERLPVRFMDGSSFMAAERPGVPRVPADPQAEGYAIHTYELRAGECGIHDALVWHGSTPNTTEEIRCALVLRYVAVGTRWLGSARIPYDDVGCPIGDGLTGDHFPLAGRHSGRSRDGARQGAARADPQPSDYSTRSNTAAIP